MIDISCENLLPNEWHQIHILHQFRLNFCLTCKESPTVALSHYVKIEKIINIRGSFSH